jgi:hypothetical protein
MCPLNSKLMLEKLSVAVPYSVTLSPTFGCVKTTGTVFGRLQAVAVAFGSV